MTSLPIVDTARLTAKAGLPGNRGNYAFVSLGCPKNLVDSERMLGLLNESGFQLTEEPDGADFVIINTCGFVEDARAESMAAIDEMLELKRRGKTRGVIVSGCLAERQQQGLLAERPEIDALIGVFGREEVAAVVDRFLGGVTEQRTVFHPAPIRALPDRNRLRITPRHFSYLKVSEGCDRLCTFCAIPNMRGKHATKPMEEVISEARQLAEDGVRELIVVAQDTTYYGLDLYGEPRLAELLTELDQVDGLEWIRLMYFYPMYISDELIETIASSRRIVPYIDMPLQHISDPVLRRMSRRVTRVETESILQRLRDRIPDLTLRTTFITGFPGETESDFEELAQFVDEQAFHHVGVFTYSTEEGTPAVKLPDAIPVEVKSDRRDRLMAVQQPIVFSRNKGLVGQQVQVLLDQPVDGEENVWCGRTRRDAPDVDGLVFVTGHEIPLNAGEFVLCEIVATQDYDLVGVAIEPGW